jgi:HD-GYP domain-containing protein (c-di-GMP phosphodiesterase class II)
MFRRVPLAMLTEGLVLASAIQDDHLRMLLNAGVPVTQDLIVSLHKRDIRTVVVTERDWQRIAAFSSTGKSRTTLPHHSQVRSAETNDGTKELDYDLDRLASCAIVPSDDPFHAKLRSPGMTRYERETITKVIDHHHQTVEQVEYLLQRLESGNSVCAGTVLATSQESLIRAAEDLDLFVCMGINPDDKSSIFSHSTRVATLAVAVGVKLGLDEKSLCELGMGCLVHDAGMLKIDPLIYESKTVLGPNDFVEIAKHPIISTDMLYKNMEGVPLGVRMVVYQMHERCDGSGYPRGTTGDKIHPLAKIAAVADAYVALVSNRPHRPAMLPYHAIAKMLADVKEGLFDSAAVRALLYTVSLFPIGSFVEMNDGRVGKSIRANGPSYDRPIIEVWKRTNLSAAPEVVDLSGSANLKVVKPLTYLH